MFSTAIHQLPSLYTYKAVESWFNNTPKPRNWPDNERPLHNARTRHYALVKEEDTYRLKLYNTSIVTRYGPNRVVLDVSYDSVTTRGFADRFIGFASLTTMHGQQALKFKDIYYKSDRVFLFVHEDDDWKLQGMHQKITRKVLDPDKKYEVHQPMKDFSLWVRSLWAVAGDDGHHPWVGHPIDKNIQHNINLLHHIQEKQYEIVAQWGMRQSARAAPRLGLEWYYDTTPAQEILTKVRKSIYRQINAYIDIDYDQPVPRRVK